MGDFNDWNPTATPMCRIPDGRWMAGLEIPHGYHQYLFLMDGVPALDPPAAGKARLDGFSEAPEASLIAVSRMKGDERAVLHLEALASFQAIRVTRLCRIWP